MQNYEPKEPVESYKSIERKYAKLMQDVATSDYYKINLSNRVNCYVCFFCGHVTKTKDVDPGVTPFMFKCEDCGNPAQSTFYKDIRPEQKPTFEWYRPTLKQVLKMRSDYILMEHVLNGGLNYRKI